AWNAVRTHRISIGSNFWLHLSPPTMKNNTLNHNEKSKPQKMKDTEEERLKEIEKCYSNILTQIGEDPNREGLQKTPERAAKALQYFCKGYEASVEQEINGAIFDEQHKEMVIVKDI